jgi:hypothetical protein
MEVLFFNLSLALNACHRDPEFQARKHGINCIVIAGLAGTLLIVSI